LKRHAITGGYLSEVGAVSGQVHVAHLSGVRDLTPVIRSRITFT
jgi:hypothetical protein